MQNDKIKEYWEGEAGIYSEGIKAELKSETAENWKNLILEYAPEKGRPNTGGQAQGAGRGGSDHPDIDDAARQGQQGNKQQEGKKDTQKNPGQPPPLPAGAVVPFSYLTGSAHETVLLGRG